MSAVQSQTARREPCGCRSDCGDSVCRVDCLERPEFFCGQVLSEGDLNALIGWVRAKHRLQRYVHGWGVVRGLAVEISPKDPGGVVVSPGYAISCCGDDIVVCDERCLSVQAALDELCIDCASRTPDAPIMLDLVVVPEERPSASAAPVTGSCGCSTPLGSDLPSRVIETGRLEWEAPRLEPDGWAAWEIDYDKVVKRLMADIDPSDWNAIKASLANHRERRQPKRVGYRVQAGQYLTKPKADPEEVDLARNLLRATLDEWLEQAARESEECLERSPVPLARVTVVCVDGWPQVIAVDDAPPHRRPLAVSGLPAPPGKINVAGVLYWPLERALVEFETLGLSVTVVEIAPFANVADFVAWHDASTGTFVARRGDLTVTAMWLDNELRVIGFGGTGVTTDDYGKLNLDKWEVQRLRDNWLLTHQHLKNAAKKWPRELKELLPERSEREINELAKGNKVGPLQRKKP